MNFNFIKTAYNAKEKPKKYTQNISLMRLFCHKIIFAAFVIFIVYQAKFIAFAEEQYYNHDK